MLEILFAALMFAAFALGYAVRGRDERTEAARKDRLIRSLSDRVHAQSELLSKRAEK
jgi:hypothetical protein